jgi:hypothetical protein
MQVWVPFLQVPTALPQSTPIRESVALVMLSSFVPLQSSSIPLQISTTVGHTGQ